MWHVIALPQLITLVLAGAGCLALSRWVLLPIHRAARERGRTADGRWRPVQFRMGDLFFLVFYLSLGLGLVVAANRLLFHNLPGDDVSYWELELFGSVFAMFIGLWWLGIRVLSRAGVRGRSRRLQFFFSLPLIYLASFALALWIVAIFLLNLMPVDSNRLVIPWDLCSACAAPIFLGALLLGLCRVVTWVASPEKSHLTSNQSSVVSLDKAQKAPSDGPETLSR